MVKREYEEARKTLENRLEKRQRINTQLNRVEAQLSSLESVLGELHTEMVRIQSMGVDQVKSQRQRIIESLREEQAQLKVFEREFEQTDTEI